jgi:hypothetical protein
MTLSQDQKSLILEIAGQNEDLFSTRYIQFLTALPDSADKDYLMSALQQTLASGLSKSEIFAGALDSIEAMQSLMKAVAINILNSRKTMFESRIATVTDKILLLETPYVETEEE